MQRRASWYEVAAYIALFAALIALMNVDRILGAVESWLQSK